MFCLTLRLMKPSRDKYWWCEVRGVLCQVEPSVPGFFKHFYLFVCRCVHVNVREVAYGSLKRASDPL